MQKWRRPYAIETYNMNSSHAELQMMFSAEDVSMEIQADWNLLEDIEAQYFGIKPVSILIRK